MQEAEYYKAPENLTTFFGYAIYLFDKILFIITSDNVLNEASNRRVYLIDDQLSYNICNDDVSQECMLSADNFFYACLKIKIQ